MKDHKQFTKLCKSWSIKARLQDVHSSKQAAEVAKNLTDQKVKEIRLRNALAKEDAKMKWQKRDLSEDLTRRIKDSLKIIMADGEDIINPKTGLQKFQQKYLSLSRTSKLKPMKTIEEEDTEKED